MFSPPEDLAIRIRDHQVHPEVTEAHETFYRNIEEALDARRASQNLYSVVKNIYRSGDGVDFCSGDVLSLGTSGVQRKEFLAELDRWPHLATGSAGSRLMDGNNSYIESAEHEIAAYHGADAGLILSTGYEANIALWTAIPRPGDVILFDELVHASTHEGMKHSLAMVKIQFAHNDVEAFRTALADIIAVYPLIHQGKRSVIVSVEGIYSMDGDICPLQEMVDVAKELCQDGQSVQFVVDEAHSVGVIGPGGAGIVCELGLQQDIAVVMHSFGKAVAAAGSIILGNKTIQLALANFAKSVIYSTAPSIPVVASIKASYRLLATEPGIEARAKIQALSRHLHSRVADHPAWPTAKKTGLLHMPLMRNWEDRSIFTQVIVLRTRDQYTWWLYFHLLSHGFSVYPIHHPVVPLGHSRIRTTLHAINTEEQVERFVDTVFSFVKEMMRIEDGETTDKVPETARHVYQWMRNEGLDGFGMV